MIRSVADVPTIPPCRADAVETPNPLRDLQALSDTSLTHLDVDELLTELLALLREILDVDTAAVLMLDRHPTDELVARAACGIEEEVRQGVRVPLGRGFAGGIAANRQPVQLARVDATTVTNPILWESGIEVMLGVPLLRGDAVSSACCTLDGSGSARLFTDQDIDLLQVVADRVAGVTQARQLAIERAAAGLLERSLLPTRLPEVPGPVRHGALRPAEGRTVGGDWYDIFTVPSGTCGSSPVTSPATASAAIVIGRIQRAAGLHDARLPPHEVSHLVDNKVDTSRSGPSRPSRGRTRRTRR